MYSWLVITLRIEANMMCKESMPDDCNIRAHPLSPQSAKSRDLQTTKNRYRGQSLCRPPRLLSYHQAIHVPFRLIKLHDLVAVLEKAQLLKRTIFVPGQALMRVLTSPAPNLQRTSTNLHLLMTVHTNPLMDSSTSLMDLFLWDG